MLNLASGFIQLGLLNLENIRILGAWFPKEDRFWSIHCFFSFSFCNSCNPLGEPLKNLWSSFVVTSGDWRKLLLSHGRLATLPSLTPQRESGPSCLSRAHLSSIINSPRGMLESRAMVCQGCGMFK